MDRPPPFESLPFDKRALRLRAVRDGLIISGWLATGFALVVVTSIGQSFGYDAYSYWSIDFNDLYGRAMNNNFALGAFRYAPPIAYLFGPLGALPWWLFLWLWAALMLAIIFWLSGRWALVVLALPPIALELYHGNVHLLMAAAIALGFRYPWTWAFVLMTKVSPGIGVLWFAFRREWRSLAIALGVTAAISLGTYVVAPHYWSEWVASIFSNLSEPQFFSVPPAAPLRLPLAVVLLFWGARTDRPWTVAIAATLALPIIWPHGLTVALAAIPFLRRGDRAALTPGWERAVSLRGFATYAAIFVGGALLIALVAGGQVEQLMNWASTLLYPYENRP
ncbi:MAG TPA: glycosyltransferase family 87 protein [Candidatus Limnocylindrales bacterium]|nr:glycosyltransferase family 87 protein [Candidatus Limnocylindrales bacterium]